MSILDDELLLSLRPVSVDERRASNSCAKHARLPTELWEHIWRLLSLVDRLTVSQVCFSWRTIALESSRLWTELDIGYCTAHPTFPACVMCNCRTNEVASPDLNLLPIVLPRSKDLPLSLRFRSTESMRPRMLDLLAEAMHRIVAVHIDAVTRNPHTPDSNLAPFCSLHSLRALRLNKLTLSRYDFLAHADLDLPNLQHLHISFGTFRDGVRAALPNVTSLHFSFSTLDEILKYLKASPRLSKLSLQVGSPDLEYWTREECTAIRQSVSQLSRIRVAGIMRDVAKWIPDMFHIASCPDISFGDSSSAFTDSSSMIFEDIEGPIRLSLQEDGPTLVARARGGCGRTRQLSDDYGTFASLTTWIAAHVPVVHTLAIDYNLVLSLVQSVPWCSTTESLTLYFRDPVHTVASRPGTLLTGTWLRLRSLTLEAPNDGYVSLSGSVVKDLVRLISPLGGLENMVLRGVYTDYDTELAVVKHPMYSPLNSPLVRLYKRGLHGAYRIVYSNHQNGRGSRIF